MLIQKIRVYLIGLGFVESVGLQILLSKIIKKYNYQIGDLEFTVNTADLPSTDQKFWIEFPEGVALEIQQKILAEVKNLTLSMQVIEVQN